MSLRRCLFVSFLVIAVLGSKHLLLQHPKDLKQIVDILIGVWLTSIFSNLKLKRNSPA